MKARIYEGDYSGDVYRAVADRKGNLVIQQGDNGETRSIPSMAAKPILQDLEAASGRASVYGDFEIAAIHHFVLERAFAR